MTNQHPYPPFKGGQGRTDEEVEATASAFLVLICATGAVLFTLLISYLLIRS